MDDKNLVEKLNKLESVNDLLLFELLSIDQLMREMGFTEGLKTVKETARDLSRFTQLEEDYN